LIFKGAKDIRIGEIKGCSSTYRKKALNNLLTRGFIIKVTRRDLSVRIRALKERLYTNLLVGLRVVVRKSDSSEMADTL